jgi:uncharacterized protein YraI
LSIKRGRRFSAAGIIRKWGDAKKKGTNAMLMKSLLGAAAVLALSTGMAAAVPATVETDANVRTGPGTGNPVITTLPAGTVVDAGPCTSWCRIAFDGGEGYMARSLLALGGSPPAVAVGPTYYDDAYYYDDYPYFGYAYGPSIGFIHRDRRWRYRDGHRGRWGNHRPGRPGWGGRPPVGGNPGGGVPKIGQSVRPGGGFAGGGGSFSGGAKASGSFGGGGAVSAPRASAPASSGSGGVSKLR